MISALYLPLIALNPRKVTGPLVLADYFFLIAIVFLRGLKESCRKIFETKEKLALYLVY